VVAAPAAEAAAVLAVEAAAPVVEGAAAVLVGPAQVAATIITATDRVRTAGRALRMGPRGGPGWVPNPLKGTG
jgi:hypothetical protein